MSNKVQITDAELEIMKVLWERGTATSPMILADISKGGNRNRNTVKTLLLRLVQKGAVKYEEINSRTYKYTPIITKDEYTSYSSDTFLNKIFGGSVDKMLLNFVRDEKISKESLQRLIDLIEEDK
jgi:BlaI family penicillinase repressor